MDKNKKNISQKFDALQAPIDKDVLWKKIESNHQFPRRKSNSKKIIWILLLLLGISFLSIQYIQRNIKPNQYFSKKDINGNTRNLKTLENNIKIINNNDLNKVTIKESNLSTNIKDYKNSTPIVKYKTTVNNLSHKHNTISNNKINENNNSIISSNLINNKEQIKSQNSIFKKENKRQKDKKQISKRNSKLKVRINNHEYLKLKSISNKIVFSRKKIDIELDKFIIPNTIQDLPISPWSISFAIGIGYLFHDIQSDEKDLDMKIRKNNSKTLESYLVEFGISRKIHKKWIISLGFDYSIDYQRFNYNFSDYKYIKNNTENPYYLKRIDNYTFKYYHKYKFLNLNLSASKIIQIKDYQLSIGLGINSILKFSIEGKVLNHKLKEQNLSSKEYNESIMFNYYSQINLSKPINEKFSIYSGVQIKMKNNLTKNNSSFTHRVTPVYFKLGITYKL